MDLNRRRALGRAAEWLGAEAAEGDILSRRLGMASRRAAATTPPSATRSPRHARTAYAAGVNAFLASGDPALPPGIRTSLAATPEPWEPWHCIAVMRRLGLLMGSVWFKLWRALALPIIGPEQRRQAPLRRR